MILAHRAPQNNFSRICLWPFKCYVTLFFWKLYTHPPPRNANNIEPYTFVMLFSRKFVTLPPPLRYVTPLLIYIYFSPFLTCLRFSLHYHVSLLSVVACTIIYLCTRILVNKIQSFYFESVHKEKTTLT